MCVVCVVYRWADQLYAKGSNPKPPHLFIHPYFQVRKTNTHAHTLLPDVTLQIIMLEKCTQLILVDSLPLCPLQAVLMFLGEMSCIVAFKIWYYYHRLTKKDLTKFGPQKFNPLIWAIPAMCDLCATSTMYLGLTWTYAASFQMLRGSVIIFTGLLSVAFLNAKLPLYKWAGMFSVIIGLALVGVGDFIFFQKGAHTDKYTVLAGDLLIIAAQGIVAVQMTFEEKIIKKYQVPALQGVGWEGIFGFSILMVLLVPMYFIPYHLPASSDFWQDRIRFEDAIDGIKQMLSNWMLMLANIGLIVSIAFFNFSGLTVTKTMSATTRMVLDSVRTIFIWVFSLSVRWQNFEPLQPVGYAVLFVGTCIYYNIIIAPSIKWVLRRSFPHSKIVRRYILSDGVDYGEHSRHPSEKEPFLKNAINEPPYGFEDSD